MTIRKTNKIWIGVTILFICILGLVCYSLSHSESKKDLDCFKIGMIISRDNQLKKHDYGIKVGVEYALKQAKNEKNEISPTIEVLAIDADTQNDQIKKQLKNLIEEKHVRVLIGSSDYELCKLESQIAYEYNIPIIVPRNIIGSKDGNLDTVYEELPNVTKETQFLASFIKKGLNAQRVAILSELSSAYQQSFTYSMMESTTKYKFSIVSNESFVAGTENYAPQLLRAMREKPDVLVIAAYPLEAGYIIDQARNNGITIPIVGPSSLDKFMDLREHATLKNMDNIYYCSLVDLNSDAFVKFSREFKEMKEYSPSRYELYGYNVAQKIILSIKKDSGDQVSDFEENLFYVMCESKEQLYLKKIIKGDVISIDTSRFVSEEN